MYVMHTYTFYSEEGKNKINDWKHEHVVVDNMNHVSQNTS